jgi:enoyl-CoA hydratase
MRGPARALRRAAGFGILPAFGGFPVSILLVEKSRGVTTLTLNRPEALNALNVALRRALADAFRELQKDGETRVVILTGAGRAFCAGIDLKELGSASRMSESGAAEATVIEAMAEFEAPIIGAINGHAITGGFELALACDVLVASRAAVFGDTHARVGILPGWGLSVKLPRLVGIVRAKAISLTGNYVSAEEAERMGLLARVVAPAELIPACRALARDMLSCEPRALRGYKRLIDETFAMGAAEARRHEARVSTEHMKGVSAGDVAGRRAGVVARGREQSQREA